MDTNTSSISSSLGNQTGLNFLQTYNNSDSDSDSDLDLDLASDSSRTSLSKPNAKRRKTATRSRCVKSMTQDVASKWNQDSSDEENDLYKKQVKQDIKTNFSIDVASDSTLFNSVDVESDPEVDHDSTLPLPLNKEQLQRLSDLSVKAIYHNDNPERIEDLSVKAIYDSNNFEKYDMDLSFFDNENSINLHDIQWNTSLDTPLSDAPCIQFCKEKLVDKTIARASSPIPQAYKEQETREYITDDSHKVLLKECYKYDHLLLGPRLYDSSRIQDLSIIVNANYEFFSNILQHWDQYHISEYKALEYSHIFLLFLYQLEYFIKNNAILALHTNNVCILKLVDQFLKLSVLRSDTTYNDLFIAQYTMGVASISQWIFDIPHGACDDLQKKVLDYFACFLEDTENKKKVYTIQAQDLQKNIVSVRILHAVIYSFRRHITKSVRKSNRFSSMEKKKHHLLDVALKDVCHISKTEAVTIQIDLYQKLFLEIKSVISIMHLVNKCDSSTISINLIKEDSFEFLKSFKKKLITVIINNDMCCNQIVLIIDFFFTVCKEYTDFSKLSLIITDLLLELPILSEKKHSLLFRLICHSSFICKERKSDQLICFIIKNRSIWVRQALELINKDYNEQQDALYVDFIFIVFFYITQLEKSSDKLYPEELLSLFPKLLCWMHHNAKYFSAELMWKASDLIIKMRVIDNEHCYKKSIRQTYKMFCAVSVKQINMNFLYFKSNILYLDIILKVYMFNKQITFHDFKDILNVFSSFPEQNIKNHHLFYLSHTLRRLPECTVMNGMEIINLLDRQDLTQEESVLLDRHVSLFRQLMQPICIAAKKIYNIISDKKRVIPKNCRMSLIHTYLKIYIYWCIFQERNVLSKNKEFVLSALVEKDIQSNDLHLQYYHRHVINKPLPPSYNQYVTHNIFEKSEQILDVDGCSLAVDAIISWCRSSVSTTYFYIEVNGPFHDMICEDSAKVPTLKTLQKRLFIRRGLEKLKEKNPRDEFIFLEILEKESRKTINLKKIILENMKSSSTLKEVLINKSAYHQFIS